jgi:hypothetical protein
MTKRSKKAREPITAEESLQIMKSFAKRKEKFVAAVKTSKD